MDALEVIVNPNLLIAEIDKALIEFYNQLELVVIFGSLAREEFVAYSDVDILVISNYVVLKDSIEKKLDDLLGSTGIGYDLIFLTKFSYEQQKNRLLLREAINEGIQLWKTSKAE